MTFRLYTVANDRMAAHLPRFLMLRRCFVPDVPLYIIPFDDNLDEVRKIIAAEDQVFLTEADPRIDTIGKTIYTDEEYRPGIPAWRYFRKLNSFIGHNEPAMFIDLNTILLADPRVFFDFSTLTINEIIFGNTSVKFRTIPQKETQDFLNKINPGWGVGFNAGLMIFKGGFLNIDFLTALKNPRVRQLTGKAPEQGLLAIYGAFFNKYARLMSNENGAILPLREPILDDVEIQKGYLKKIAGPFKGRTIMASKHVSQDFKDLPGIYEEFIRIKCSSHCNI